MTSAEIANSARTLLAREQAAGAFALLAPALAQDPDNIDLLLALAETLTELDRPAEATAAYRGVLALDPRHPDALAKVAEATAAMETLLRLAHFADETRAWEEARENYEAVLYQDPNSILALTRLLVMDGIEGRLPEGGRHHRELAEALESLDLMGVHPNTLAMVAYQAVFRPLAPDTLAKVTSALSRHTMALAEAFGPLPPPLPKTPGRLRVGYLSTMLRDHPIGHVTQALFGAHDRTKVEVHIFYRPQGEPNPYTDQIKAGADVFHAADDVEQLLRAIARQNLDVLVYLDGYMAPQLLPILARRPAPVQVYWLGHAGSCDVAGVDYVLADDVVAPPAENSLYRAKVIRLPAPYHPASPQRIGEQTSRAEEGLPETGFVFCAFNNPEKIDTPTFDLWMRILGRVPGSVLWLSLTQSDLLVENLRAEAKKRGIGGERLVFARRVADKTAHLARHRHAGLFLDTLGLNASTTALDALWTGLPLLTVTGSRFASRIATTFLRALDLEDLICATPAAFEECAVLHASEPARLAALRGRLEANLKTSALFQIEPFCRKLEATLLELQASHRR